MRFVRFAAVACAFAVASTPALADKIFAVTPSGTAEMLFPDKPAAVIGKLSSRCIDVKWTVTSSTSNEVVCEAPLNMGQSIMGQLLMGNSYSTPPRRFFRFNVAEVNGVSRVQASGWMELQMAFGQMKRTDFTGAEFHNGAVNFMSAAGGKLPLGTTFPNHVMMGFHSDNIDVGKTKGMRIKELVPGSPAEKAGLQIGDVVVRIAGKSFKNDADYLDATARAAAKPTYPVEFTRAGKSMTLNLERAFRPAWTEQVIAAAEPAASAPALAPPFSVADELSKLSKLKDAGTITEAEFEAQKKKLLER